MFNLIKMDLYRMFRTKSMYVIWIVMLSLVLLTTFFSKEDYDPVMEEAAAQEEMAELSEAETDEWDDEEMEESDDEELVIGMNVVLPTEAGEKVTVFDNFFANAQAKFLALFLVIFAVLFSTADISSGYVKNIGGQLPKRGALIVSRAVALAVFTALSLVGVILFQAVANRIVFGELVWGDVRASITYLLTETALHYALVLICMAIAITLNNNAISIVIAVCLTMNVMSIVYVFLNNIIQKAGIHDFRIYDYTVTGKMSMLSMAPSGSECLTALAVSAVFGVLMIAGSSMIFQKRDI